MSERIPARTAIAARLAAEVRYLGEVSLSMPDERELASLLEDVAAVLGVYSSRTGKWRGGGEVPHRSWRARGQLHVQWWARDPATSVLIARALGMRARLRGGAVQSERIDREPDEKEEWQL